MKPDVFLDMLYAPARECQRVNGIPSSFTLAQAALESGWGASKLSAEGCNLFGVKADPSWNGPVVLMKTYEYAKGKRILVMAKWRAYANWQQCLDDHAAFFRRNKRYAKCWAEKTGEGWARAVAAAGYATDPKYAEKLIATMRARNLGRFDTLEN
jgi:flagellum-specific peptidoglycan hydrolase FlgJ